MFNLSKIEEEILKFWQENKIFEKSLAKESPQGDFVFYDGPPFATGLPHYGHILGSTAKDVVGRYWTMKGYHVARRWGWDCHGLPIENIVEKKLQINSKKEIEKLGVDKFNESCRAQVLTHVKEWGKTVERIGRWVDFENSYKTMDNSYIESVWWAFKEIWDKGLIYEGKKVLLNCPRCETPIAKAEVAMDNSYQDVTEAAVYVKFKVKGAANTYLLVWTTTPWTLPGNVVLAVKSDITYAKVKLQEEEYIIAQALVEKVLSEQKYELGEEVKGSDLIGSKYEPLYEIEGVVGGPGPVHEVVAADFVNTEEGTGIVHTAVVYGEDDYHLGLQLGLPMIPLLDAKAMFNTRAPDFLQGQYFKKADELVINDLQKKELLFRQAPHTHSYPHCFRCDTPLFYNAIDAWFINIQKIKPRLLELNEQLNWHPKHMKHGRFRNSLEEAPDWNISRNRYWAAALPIWKCQSKDCQAVKVIGSLAELQAQAVNAPNGAIDLHKHVVDTIELKCEKCGRTMRRIPEVIDCWFESASMPFAAVHYPFENQSWLKENFPAQFIAEYTGQVRTWFYYMLVVSAVLFDNNPFENIVVTGTIQAADGSKMSKSRQNFPDPWKIFEAYGVDALRIYFMGSSLMKAEDMNFSEQTLKEKSRMFVTLLNVLSFYQIFAKYFKVDDLQAEDLKHPLDLWITAELNGLVSQVTAKLDDYDIAGAARPFEVFIDNLSTWYLRRSRGRFKSLDNQVKLPALKTLRCVLFHLSQLMAPFTPFVADYIYRALDAAGLSVHLQDWPQLNFEAVTSKSQVLEKMSQVRQVVELGLSERDKAGIPVRQPLAALQLTTANLQLTDDYIQLMKEELNVKEVRLVSGESELSVTLDTVITAELKLEGLKRELVRQINALRKKQGMTIEDTVALVVKTEAEEIKQVLDKYGDEILHSTIANQFGEAKNNLTEVKIGDNKVLIGLKK